MSEEEKLYKILEDAREVNNVVFNNAPYDLNRAEFEEYMNKSNMAVLKASRDYRMVKTPKIDIDPDKIGHKMALKDFIKLCELGEFSDDDGYGLYSIDGKTSNIKIYPSDVEYNCIRNDFNEIIWYNK